MKPLKPNTALVILLAILPALLLTLIWMRAKERRDASYIEGIVVDETPDLSENALARFERPISAEDFAQLYVALYTNASPVPRALVTARSGLVTKTTHTDSKGKFKFHGLPNGAYEIFAEVPSGAGRKAMATLKPVRRYLRGTTPTGSVQVRVRSDLVTVRGRIVDGDGNPIVGANVRGEPFPMPDIDEITPPTRFAVSGTDGVYEMSGFPAPTLGHIWCYLAGFDPTVSGAGGPCSPFFVRIFVQADGFEQDKTKIPEIPLVTEELLGPARRLLNIRTKLAKEVEGAAELTEKEGVYLPPSEGNVITGIDIVLTKQTAVR